MQPASLSGNERRECCHGLKTARWCGPDPGLDPGDYPARGFHACARSLTAGGVRPRLNQRSESQPKAVSTGFSLRIRTYPRVSAALRAITRVRDSHRMAETNGLGEARGRVWPDGARAPARHDVQVGKRQRTIRAKHDQRVTNVGLYRTEERRIHAVRSHTRSELRQCPGSL